MKGDKTPGTHTVPKSYSKGTGLVWMRGDRAASFFRVSKAEKLQEEF